MAKTKASLKCLKTTTKLHYMKNKDNEHIRPLWLAQSENSKYIRQTVKSIQELAATSFQSTGLKNYLAKND